RGPALFSGYHRDEAATQAAMKDGWLCTGDLGFLHDGELYVTGRLSDRLIVKGANIAPHELEWIAEQASGAGGSCRAAAFSIARGSGGEQAILAVETTERDPGRLAAMERDIRDRVGRSLALQLADLAWVRRGQLPRTTSGKVRRTATRLLYEQG